MNRYVSVIGLLRALGSASAFKGGLQRALAMLLLASTALFAAGTAQAAHYRGGSATHTISSSGVVTVEMYTAWDNANVGSPTVSVIAPGGGNLGAMSNTVAQTVLTGTEFGGAGYTVRRHVFTYNLASPVRPAGLYTFRFASNSWVAGINNMAESNWQLETVGRYIPGTATNGPTMAPATVDVIGRGLVYAQSLDSSDPDGTPVSFALLSTGTNVSAPPQPAIFPGLSINNGVVNVSAANTATLALGRWHYRALVTDAGGATASRDVLVVVQDTAGNQPPVLSSIGPKTVAVGSTLTFGASATDPDSGQTLTLRGRQLPAGATFPQVVSATPSSTFAWTPPPGSEGTYSIFVEAFDSHPTPLIDSELVTITVTGSNHPPVLAPIGSKTVANGGTLTFQLSATDPDGHAITYSAAFLPAGATFAGNTFSWTPSAGQSNNTFTGIVLRATDNGAPPLFAEESIAITVGAGNQPPVIAPLSNITVPVGQAVTFAVSATDSSATQNLTLAPGTGGLLPGATFPTVTGTSPVSSTFNWTPTVAGAYTMRFRVEDNGSPILSQEIAVTISASNAVDGVCGTAAGVAVTSAPASNLCAVGTASAVASGAASYTWSCAGSGGGASPSCAAPRQYNTVTSITAVSPAASSSTGQTVTVTVGVQGGDPTGSVTVVSQNASPARSCVASLSGGGSTATGTCTFSIAGGNALRVAQGGTAFVANYAGEAAGNDLASSSTPVSHSVTQGSVSLGASGIPASVVTTQPFLVTVSGTTSSGEALSGDGTAADDIVLQASLGSSCGIDIDAGESACALQVNAVAAGRPTKGMSAAKSLQSITAEYLGNVEFVGSGDVPVGTTDATTADTTTVLSTMGSSSGGDPSPVGEPVALTATVTVNAPGTGIASGTVRFVDGNAITLGEVAVGPGGSAMFIVSPGPSTPGSYEYSAFFLSNVTFNGSDELDAHAVVAADTSTAIVGVSPASGPSIETGETVTVSASVSPTSPGAGTPGGVIQVREIGGGATTSGCDIVLPASSCTLTYATLGTSTLQATYAGSSSFNASGAASGTASVSVLGQPVTLALVPQSPAYFGDGYTVAYDIAGGSNSYDGNVSVVSDSLTGVCTAPDASGGGTCVFAAGENAGPHALTGSYGADTVNATSSGAAAQAILPAQVSLSMSDTPADGASVGASVGIDVVAQVVLGTGTATGTVLVTGQDTAGCAIVLAGGTGSCSLSFSQSGNDKALLATYASNDANYTGVDSPETASETHDVQNAITSLAIDAVSGGSIGQAASVSYTLSGCFGSCDGAVTVTANPGAIACPAPTTFSGSGTATGSCTFPAGAFQTVQAYSIVVTVADSGDEAGDSASAAFTPALAASQTALSFSPSGASQPAGTSVTFNVAVTPAAGLSLATAAQGTVTVFDGATPLAGCAALPLGATGTASCVLALNTVHTLNLTASYSGDGNFLASATPAAQPLAITAATTTITATRSPTASVVGQDVTVSFTVSGGADAGAGRYLGTVSVSAGTAGCGPVAIDPASGTGSCVIDGAAANGFIHTGSVSIVASYSGDANDGSSASTPIVHAVSASGTATDLTTVNDPSYPGEAFLLRATVTSLAPGERVPTGNVEFFQSGSSIGVRPINALGIAELTGLVRPVGTYNFRAAYIGNADFGTSQDLNDPHQVVKGTVTFAVSTSASPTQALVPVTVNIALAPVAPAVTAPSGIVTVTFASGETCSITLPANSCVVTPTSQGTHTVTAVYAGDINYIAPANAVTSQVVQPIATTLTLGAVAPTPVYFGDGYSVPYTVAGGDGTFDGAVTLSSGALAGACSHAAATGVGMCVFAAGQDAGSYALAGSYAGDSNDATSTASGSVTVQPAEFSFVIADAPDDGALVNANVAITATLTALHGSGTPNGNLVVSGDDTLGCNIAVGSGGPTVCNLVFSTAGNKTLTATYVSGTPVNHVAAGPASATHDVAPLVTVLAIGTVPGDVNFGEGYSIPYLLSAGQPPYSGAVSLIAGAAVGTCAHDSFGHGSCTIAAGQNQGTYALQADYNGDAVNDVANDTDSVAIAPAVLAIGLSDAPASTDVGPANPVTITASISVIDGAGSADGSIAIVGGSGGSDCSIVLPATSCDVVYTTIGSKTITGVYTSASGNFVAQAGDPQAITHDVVPAATTLVVSPIAAVTIGDAVGIDFNINGCFGDCDGTIAITSTPDGATCDSITFDSTTGTGTCTFPAGNFRTVQPYTVTVAFTGSGDDADSSQTATFTPGKGTATLAFADLLHTYDGQPHAALVSASCTADASATAPACDGLQPSDIIVTYATAADGCGAATATLPVSVGDYVVCATVNDANFAGSDQAAFTIETSTVLVDLDGPGQGVAVGQAAYYLVKLDNIDIGSGLAENVAFDIDIALAPNATPNLFGVQYDAGGGYVDAGVPTAAPGGGLRYTFDNGGLGYPVAAAGSLLHRLRVSYADDADYVVRLVARGIASLGYGVDDVATQVIAPQGQLQLSLAGPTDGVQLFSDAVFLSEFANLGEALPEDARVEYCVTVTPLGDVTARDATAADLDLQFEFGASSSYGIGPIPLMLIDGCTLGSSNPVPEDYILFSRITANVATAGTYVQMMRIVGDSGTVYAAANLATAVDDLPPAGRSLDLQGPLAAVVGPSVDFLGTLQNNASSIAGLEELRLRVTRNGVPATASDLTIEYSIDNGATWSTLNLDGNGWGTVLPNADVPAFDFAPGFDETAQFRVSYHHVGDYVGQAQLRGAASPNAVYLSDTITTDVDRGAAQISISNLAQAYDGAAKPVSVSVLPATISASSVSITYSAAGYPASATAPNAIGSYTVTVTVNDSDYVGTATATLNIVAASPDSIALTVNGGGSASAIVGSSGAYAFAATVLGVDGNPVPGVSVTFLAPTGALEPAGAVVLTDASGVASFTADAGALAGSFAVSAQTASIAAADSVVVDNLADVASSIVLTATPSSAVAGEGAYTLVATVRDQYLNPVSVGTAVAFVATPNPGTGAGLAPATSNAVTLGGVAQVTVPANAFAGSFSVRANVGSVNSAAIALENTVDTDNIGLVLDGDPVGAVKLSGEPQYSYTSGTTSNSGAAPSENVIGRVTVARAGGGVASDLAVDYLAPNPTCVPATEPQFAGGFWCPLSLTDGNADGVLDGVFGAGAGFPLSAATSHFRTRFAKGGSYVTTVAIVGVNSGSVYASAAQQIDVAQLALSGIAATSGDTGVVLDSAVTLSNTGTAALSNAAAAPNDENVVGRFRITRNDGGPVALADGDIELQYLFGADYFTLDLVEAGGALEGDFGGLSGFPVSVGYTGTSLFRSRFLQPGVYTVATQIVGVDSDAVFANFVQTVSIDTSNASIDIDAATLSRLYTGAAQTVTATTVPAGLAYAVSYDGSATAPTNAGTYAVVASITAPGFGGSDSDTLTIAKASSAVVFAGSTSVTYDGAPHALTATLATEPGNAAACTVSYAPDPSPAAAPTAAGLYVVTALCDGLNHTGTGIATLSIVEASAVSIALTSVPPMALVTPATAPYTDFVDYIGELSNAGSATAQPVHYAITVTRIDDGNAPAGQPAAIAVDDVKVCLFDPSGWQAQEPDFHDGCEQDYQILFKTAGTADGRSAVLLRYPNNPANDLPLPGTGGAAVPLSASNFRFRRGEYHVQVDVVGSVDGTIYASTDGSTTVPDASVSYSGATSGPAEAALLSQTTLRNDGGPVDGNVIVRATLRDADGGTLLPANAEFAYQLGASYATLPWVETPADGSLVTYFGPGAGFALEDGHDATTAGRAIFHRTGNYSLQYDVLDAATRTVLFATQTVTPIQIAPNATVFALSDLTQTYDGTPRAVTVTPADVPRTITYEALTGATCPSAPATGTATAPTNAGQYCVWVQATGSYSGNASGLLTIAKATTTVTLVDTDATPGDSVIQRTFNGAPQVVTATASPAISGSIAITYDAASAAPSAVGTYIVNAVVVDPNYTGSASGSLVIGNTQTGIAFSSAPLGAVVQADSAVQRYTLSSATTSNAGAALGENVVGRIAITRPSGAAPGDVALDYFAIAQESAACQSAAGGWWCPLTLADAGNDGTLDGTFGPAAGFPFANATSQFRARYARGGRYITTVQMVGVTSGGVYASGAHHVDVAELALSASGASAGTTGATIDSAIGLRNLGTAAISNAVVAPNDENVIGRFSIALDGGATALAGADVAVDYLAGSSYLPITLSAAGGTLQGEFGPHTGFPVGAGYDATSLFRSTFLRAGNYTVTTRIVGVETGAVFDTVQQTVVIAASNATVTIDPSSLSRVYNGAAQPVPVSTSPAGLAHEVTYDGGTALPVNAGDYAVLASITEPGYEGSASAVLSIAKAVSAVNFAGATTVQYTGAAHGLAATLAADGSSCDIAYAPGVPVNAGTYIATATCDSTNHIGSGVATLTITKAPSTVTIDATDLDQVYGSTRAVDASASPLSSGTVAVTYDGASTPPTDVGGYLVVATVVDPNYTGSANAILTVIEASDIAIVLTSVPEMAQVTPATAPYTDFVDYAGTLSNAGSATVQPVHYLISVARIDDGNAPAGQPMPIAADDVKVCLEDASGWAAQEPDAHDGCLQDFQSLWLHDAAATLNGRPAVQFRYPNLPANDQPLPATGGASIDLPATAFRFKRGEYLVQVDVVGSNDGAIYASDAGTTTVPDASVTYSGALSGPTETPLLSQTTLRNDGGRVAGNVIVRVTLSDAGGATLAPADATLEYQLGAGYSALPWVGSSVDGGLVTYFGPPPGFELADGHDATTAARGIFHRAGEYRLHYEVLDAATMTDAFATHTVTPISIGANQVEFALSDLAQGYDGAPKPVTVIATPASATYAVTYEARTGTCPPAAIAPLAGAPTDAGSYCVWVQATGSYAGNAAGVLTIAKATTAVTLVDTDATPGDNVIQRTFNGAPQPVTATSAAMLTGSIAVSYDGSSTAPSAAGTYVVNAVVVDPNYTGATTGSLVIGATDTTLSLGGDSVGAVTDASSTPLHTRISATTAIGVQPLDELVRGRIAITRSGGANAGDIAIDYRAAVQENGACVAGDGAWWCPLPLAEGPAGVFAGDFGPPSGFPFSNITSQFRARFGAGGHYVATVRITGVDTGAEYASSARHVDVAELTLAASGTSSGGTGAALDSAVTLANIGTAAVAATAATPNDENVIGRFRIERNGGDPLAVADVDVSYLAGSSYLPITLTTDSGALEGSFGPGSGFPVAAGYSATSLFRSSFLLAGSYTVTTRMVGVDSGTVFATVSQPVDITSSSATVTIDPASLSRVFDGAPQPVSVSTTPAGLAVNVTYDGDTLVPSNAGSYAVVATVTTPGYDASASATLVIAKATAQVTLGDLLQVYDGAPKSVSVVTTPSGLDVDVSYAGDHTAVGSYAVTAVVDDANYTGETGGTLTILAAPLAGIEIVGTSSFSGIAGLPLDGALPTVRVFDSAGDAASGVAVLFTDSSGVASIAITGSDGLTPVDEWTLARTAGSNTMTAQVVGQPGLPVVQFTAIGAEVADIAVLNTATVTVAERGDAVTYTIEVSNGGPSHAAAVQIAAMLPDSLDLASATWMCTPTGDALCELDSGGGHVDVGAYVPVGDTVVVTLSANIAADADYAAFDSTATVVLTSGTDANPTNDSSSHTITVVAKPDAVFSDGFEDSEAAPAAVSASAKSDQPDVLAWAPDWSRVGQRPVALLDVLQGGDTQVSLDGLRIGKRAFVRTRHRDTGGREAIGAWVAADARLAMKFSWDVALDGAELRFRQDAQSKDGLRVGLEAGQPLPERLRVLRAAQSAGR